MSLPDREHESANNVWPCGGATWEVLVMGKGRKQGLFVKPFDQSFVQYVTNAENNHRNPSAMSRPDRPPQ